MNNWEKLSNPPAWALKTISDGRLRGKTDINPQWRYKAITEVFGPCGIGWKYKIVRVWQEPAAEKAVFCFAEIKFYYKDNENWSESIPGIGGSKLIQLEKKGLHSNDEGYKMAVTDALSVALKMIGVGSSIYEGGNHDSKYEKPKEKNLSTQDTKEYPKITKDQSIELYDILTKKGYAFKELMPSINKQCKTVYFNLDDVTVDKFDFIKSQLEKLKTK